MYVTVISKVLIILTHTGSYGKVRSMASLLYNALIKCYQIIQIWKLEFNGYLMV